MKKNVLFMMLCAVLLTSCFFNFHDERRIEPSNNIVKKEFKMTAFDKIETEVVGNVKFIQTKDSNYRVVVSAPENYIELFSFRVDGRELKVEHSRNGVNIDPEHVDVTVYAPWLIKLDNEGLCNIEITSLNAYMLEIENSGVGSLFLSGLSVKNLDADCDGVGSIELSGVAEHAKLECSGVGSIKAEQLKAVRVQADVSGVGGITCYATYQIDGILSGVGSLKYGGKPKVKNLNRQGVGSISEF